MAEDGKQLYEFTQAGFFAGTHYKAGERIRLHPRQAQYELHRLRLVGLPEEPAAAAEADDGPRPRSLSRRGSVQRKE